MLPDTMQIERRAERMFKHWSVAWPLHTVYINTWYTCTSCYLLLHSGKADKWILLSVNFSVSGYFTRRYHLYIITSICCMLSCCLHQTKSALFITWQVTSWDHLYSIASMICCCIMPLNSIPRAWCTPIPMLPASIYNSIITQYTLLSCCRLQTITSWDLYCYAVFSIFCPYQDKIFSKLCTMLS